MGVGTPLDEVEFVARSRHRVSVLETLASSPCTRSDLHERMEIPQPTLSRVLRDFGERGWVVRDGHEYRLTPLGHLLVEEFDSLLDTVETIQELRGVIDWLPCEKFDFDLRCFAGATVTTPTESDSIAPVRRAAELTRNLDWGRFVVRAATPITAAAYRDAAVGGTRLEAVLSADAVATVTADREMAAYYEEIVRSERGAVFRYDGLIPYIAGVGSIDGSEAAGIGLIDESGLPRGYVDTDDEAIRSWVERVVDRYQEDADRLEPGAFEG